MIVVAYRGAARRGASAPECPRRHDCRQNSHGGTSEGHHPDKGSVTATKITAGNPNATAIQIRFLKNSSARPLQKMPRRAHGHRLLHQSGLLRSLSGYGSILPSCNEKRITQLQYLLQLSLRTSENSVMTKFRRIPYF